jgi:hypothetical protein
VAGTAQIGETESFWTIKAADQSPPLFELIGKAATALLGTGETALRITSVAAGVIFLLWVAARAWRYRRDAARMAYWCLLGMAALSGPLVFYAKEARAYSLAAALCGVLTVKFWERWRQGWRVASLPGWGEAWTFAAVAWTHYTALALAAPMWLAYSWEALRRRAWRAEIRLIVMPLALLAWLALSWYGFRLTVQGRAGWGLHIDLDAVLAHLVSDNLSQAAWLARLGLVADAARGRNGLGKNTVWAGLRPFLRPSCRIDEFDAGQCRNFGTVRRFFLAIYRHSGRQPYRSPAPSVVRVPRALPGAGRAIELGGVTLALAIVDFAAGGAIPTAATPSGHKENRYSYCGRFRARPAATGRFGAG